MVRESSLISISLPYPPSSITLPPTNSTNRWVPSRSRIARRTFTFCSFVQSSLVSCSSLKMIFSIEYSFFLEDSSKSLASSILLAPNQRRIRTWPAHLFIPRGSDEDALRPIAYPPYPLPPRLTASFVPALLAGFQALAARSRRQNAAISGLHVIRTRHTSAHQFAQDPAH